MDPLILLLAAAGLLMILGAGAALVFGGLDLLDRIKRGLVAGVRSAGKKNIAELVGTRVEDWSSGRAE